MARYDISALKEVDTYSMLLFVIYQLSKDPRYTTLSELVYLLNKEDLFKLLDYFGGTTIKIPTKKEMMTLVNTLLVYQYIKYGGLTYSAAIGRLKNLDGDQYNEIKELLPKVTKIVETYYE